MFSKQTFHGYMNDISRKYQRFDPCGQTFMSLKTFIECFFAWALKMQIDFRWGCHGCNGPSKRLACDVTKIEFKNMFATRIETLSIFPMKQAPHRRLDRCFIANSDGSNVRFTAARTQFQSLWEMVMSCQYNESEISDKYSTLEFEYLPSKSRPTSKRMTSNNISRDVRLYCARLFKLLSHYLALDAVIPLKIVNRTIEITVQVFPDAFSIDNIAIFSNYLKDYCPEFAKLISTSINTESVCPIDAFFIATTLCRVCQKLPWVRCTFRKCRDHSTFL